MTTKHISAPADPAILDLSRAPAAVYFDPDRMLSTNEVTKLLSISRAFLHVLVRRGDLVPMRFARGVRFRRRDVLAFCEARIGGDRATPPRVAA